MSHTMHFTHFMGAIVGVLGVSIAIYLQLITSKHCPIKYIVLFLVFGITMIMINSGPFIASSQQLLILQFIAYLILAIIEIGTAYFIWRTLDLENPVLEVHNEFVSDKNA